MNEKIIRKVCGKGEKDEDRRLGVVERWLEKDGKRVGKRRW